MACLYVHAAEYHIVFETHLALARLVAFVAGWLIVVGVVVLVSGCRRSCMGVSIAPGSSGSSSGTTVRLHIYAVPACCMSTRFMRTERLSWQSSLRCHPLKGLHKCRRCCARCSLGLVGFKCKFCAERAQGPAAAATAVLVLLVPALDAANLEE
jgi:hypothetical protein